MTVHSTKYTSYQSKLFFISQFQHVSDYIDIYRETTLKVTQWYASFYVSTEHLRSVTFYTVILRAPLLVSPEVYLNPYRKLYMNRVRQDEVFCIILCNIIGLIVFYLYAHQRVKRSLNSRLASRVVHKVPIRLYRSKCLI